MESFLIRDKSCVYIGRMPFTVMSFYEQAEIEKKGKKR